MNSLSTSVFLSAAAGAIELFMGRSLLPPEGFKLWTPETNGPHTSQWFLDPYSVTHLEHGLLLYALFVGPLRLSSWGFVPLFNMASAVECLWEVVENSDWVIQRYRSVGYPDYYGDTVLNSQGDIWCEMLAFWFASEYLVSPWRALGVSLVIDGLFYLKYKDSLFQNILKLTGGKN